MIAHPHERNASAMPNARRRGPPRFPLAGRALPRHVVIVLIGAFLVYLFGAVHENWSPMHRWNRAAADASLVLLAFTMGVGPLARLRRGLRRLIPFRRELGIYAVLLAVAHTVIILAGWVEWDMARLFGLGFHPDLGRYVMVEHGFGLANLVGILALGYGLVLTITSSDRAVRFLGGSTWKFIQTGAYALWVLVLAHTAHFLFMHFLDFHRPLPPPSPLQWPFVGVVMVVLILRIFASIRIWRQKRLASAIRSSPARPLAQA